MSLKLDSGSLTPSDIRSAAWQTTLCEIEIQKEEFQQFGILADWSKETTYRTLVLAEAELVYKNNHISHSVYVTFNLDAAQLGERYAKFGHFLTAKKPNETAILWLSKFWEWLGEWKDKEVLLSMVSPFCLLPSKNGSLEFV
ncbi:hypothetical protein ARMGADRAFT_1137439 [Armillaria gallica]|uniref:Uncharacterized protein n=1 Tax=Armillaria gallica TaxID=47427 RepID=A0A2H3CMZ8_ARMGA|nr:hypothetical protein ARMGADRAFT_1137439 [Armillaria gallica]